MTLWQSKAAPGATAQLFSERGASFTTAPTAPGKWPRGSFLPGAILLRPPQQRGKRKLGIFPEVFLHGCTELDGVLRPSVCGDEAVEPATSDLH